MLVLGSIFLQIIIILYPIQAGTLFLYVSFLP